MSNLPYVAFYPGKWLGRTARLSAAERGIFITLICEMYETMRPLKMDYRALARLCGTTPKTLEKTLAILLADENKLVLKDGALWNHRVQKEIDSAKKRSDISRKNSQKRWEKTQQKQQNPDATALPRECYPEPDLDKEDISTGLDSSSNPSLSENSINIVPADAGSPSKYFFEAETIKLNEADFRKWEEAYNLLSLRSELFAMDEWAGKQSNWFFAVSAALGKRQRELNRQIQMANTGGGERRRAVGIDPRL